MSTEVLNWTAAVDSVFLTGTLNLYLLTISIPLIMAVSLAVEYSRAGLPWIVIPHHPNWVLEMTYPPHTPSSIQTRTTIRQAMMVGEVARPNIRSTQLRLGAHLFADQPPSRWFCTAMHPKLYAARLMKTHPRFGSTMPESARRRHKDGALDAMLPSSIESHSCSASVQSEQSRRGMITCMEGCRIKIPSGSVQACAQGRLNLSQ